MLFQFGCAKTDVPFDRLLLKIRNKCDALLPFLLHCQEIGAVQSAPEEYRDLISVLSSRYAVCAFVHMSAVELLEQLLENDQCLQSSAFLRSLQREIPVMFTLLTEIASVPTYFKPIFKRLITLSRIPFLRVCQMMKGDIFEEKTFFLPLFT